MGGIITLKNAIGLQVHVLRAARLVTLSGIVQRNRIRIDDSSQNSHHGRISSKGTTAIPDRQISRIHQQEISTMPRTSKTNLGDHRTSPKDRTITVVDPIRADIKGGSSNLRLGFLPLLNKKLRPPMMWWRV